MSESKKIKTVAIILKGTFKQKIYHGDSAEKLYRWRDWEGISKNCGGLIVLSDGLSEKAEASCILRRDVTESQTVPVKILEPGSKSN